MIIKQIIIMKRQQEKNYERLRLLVIAAVILAVGSFATIGAEPSASAHTGHLLALVQRACVVYQTYPATDDCSMTIDSYIQSSLTKFTFMRTALLSFWLISK
jgi:hypothetical protein